MNQLHKITLLALTAALALVPNLVAYTYQLPHDTYSPSDGFDTGIGTAGDRFTSYVSFAVESEYTILTGASFGLYVHNASFAPTLYVYGAQENSPAGGLTLLHREEVDGSNWLAGLNTYTFSAPVDVSAYTYFFTGIDYGDARLAHPSGGMIGSSHSTWVKLAAGDSDSTIDPLSKYSIPYTYVIRAHATSAIPEPSTYALMAGAAMGAFVVVRRRRSA